MAALEAPPTRRIARGSRTSRGCARAATANEAEAGLRPRQPPAASGSASAISSCSSVRPADRDHHVLPAAGDVGHRRTTHGLGQLEAPQLVTGRLVERHQHADAGRAAIGRTRLGDRLRDEEQRLGRRAASPAPGPRSATRRASASRDRRAPDGRADRRRAAPATRSSPLLRSIAVRRVQGGLKSGRPCGPSTSTNCGR